MWWISLCVYLLFLWSNGLKIFEHSLSNTDYKLFYHRTADFGPDKYNVSGQLKLMQPLKGCDIEQYKSKNDENNQYQQIYQGEIVLILRGNCTFSKKVHHSQLLGAKGVIIGDYNTSNGEEWIVMSKDSNDGYDINIPSIFIPHNTYQWIYKLLLSDINNNTYAILDSEGEYVAPSSAFWLAAFGIVIIIIPTLWCFIVCMALLRKKIINYVERSRRSQHLSTIPIILYKDKDKNKEKDKDKDKDKLKVSVITTKINNKNKNEEYITTSYAKLEENDGEEKDEINDKTDRKCIIEEKDNGVIKNMSQFLLNQFRGQKEYFNPHNDSCAICLDDFIINEQLRLLPCNHGFHIKCIDPWLSKSSELCPMCKQSIFIHSQNNSSKSYRYCCPSLLKICCISSQQNQNENQNENDDDDDQQQQQQEEEQNEIESDIIVLRSSVDSESDNDDEDDNDNDNDDVQVS